MRVVCPWEGGGEEKREETSMGHIAVARPRAGHPKQCLTLNYRVLIGKKCNPFLFLTCDRTGAQKGSNNQARVGPVPQGPRAATGGSYLRCCPEAKNVLAASKA